MTEVFEKRVLSSDGVHELVGTVYMPEGTPKGLFHVVHGMTEHIGRYDRFMRAVAEQGFICFGYDHLGHGRTALDESEFGYIARKDGWKRLAEDVSLFGETMKAEYGERLTYVLMGHSMGSFVVRTAAVTTFVPDKLVVMGTGGPNPASGVGLLLLKLIGFFKGQRSRSELVEKLIFGNYNDTFADENDPKSWLAKDPAVRSAYAGDPLSGFKFTISAHKDLIHLLRFSNNKSWAKKLDKSIPVLLVSGECDPVGDYGKGVRKVNEMLEDAGAQVTMKLYPDCRHEILNDYCGDEVYADILAFAKGDESAKA